MGMDPPPAGHIQMVDEVYEVFQDTLGNIRYAAELVHNIGSAPSHDPHKVRLRKHWMNVGKHTSCIKTHPLTLYMRAVIDFFVAYFFRCLYPRSLSLLLCVTIISHCLISSSHSTCLECRPRSASSCIDCPNAPPRSLPSYLQSQSVHYDVRLP